LGTEGNKQTFKKAAKNWHDDKMKWKHWAAALKAYGIFLVFLFCNIHIQTTCRYYKKRIYHCNIAKYY